MNYCIVANTIQKPICTVNVCLLLDNQ